MKTQHRFNFSLWIILATFLIAALPVSTAFAQLAKPDGISDGITTPPHDRPLNFYSPCSQCHIRFDQWAESMFEIKKAKIETAEDFKAVRDLQYQLAKKMAIRCTGSCGHPKNYQMHPPREQSCTLCHDKYLENHESINMAINEFDPAASCDTGCHKKPGLELLGDKIPYWSMAFTQVDETGTADLAALLTRTQIAAGSMALPDSPIGPLNEAEGKWKHEIKSRLGFLVNEDLAQIGGMLGNNLVWLTDSAYPDVIKGSLEGKVEAKSEESNDALQEFMLTFDHDLKTLAEFIKETKLESKYKPALPDKARAFIIREVEKRFTDDDDEDRFGPLILKEDKEDKVVWTLDDAEIKVEFKEEETKFKFTNFPSLPSQGFFTAILVLSKIEKKYPDATLDEAKFVHAYAGKDDARWLIADTIKAYVSMLPDKEIKYELKGAKDTETVPDIAELMPLKVDQYPGEDILKLKTEIKVKFEKPHEPELKSEVAIAEPEPEPEPETE